ncbi:MAG: hypothetical protein RSB91_00285 [Clostridia bacterium]
MSDREDCITLTIPTGGSFALIARMALSGFGMLAGLDVDLIADLRMVTDECCDCLTHQPCAPERIGVRAWLANDALHCCFTAEVRGERIAEPSLELDVTRGVLETLMPDVRLDTDDGGVYQISCAMPV